MRFSKEMKCGIKIKNINKHMNIIMSNCFITVPIIPEFLYNIRHRDEGITYESFEADLAQQAIADAKAAADAKALTTPETLFVTEIPTNMS